VSVDGETVCDERLAKTEPSFCSGWLVFHWDGRAFGPGSFRDLWRTTIKKAGLPPGRLFHDLRRSAVRNLIRSGVDPSVAMNSLGRGWCRRWDLNPH
jgi:hypothetical protein